MTRAPTDKTLFGHPVGLYTIFFAEMWERFSYYGMRALLVLYMIKGFLKMNDGDAYAVYGAYTALVYATPFIGGMLADRLLGARRAAVLGGALMAAGHLLMTVQTSLAFYLALGLLITGNGFFKPNLSTMVGGLYRPGSTRRDGGFTIFYMGINLGGAMSPLICGYIGETYGWHYGFGLATIGMLTGLAVFVAPIRLTQLLIGLGALGTATAMLFLQNNTYQLLANVVVGVALVAAAIAALVALNRGGLPESAGAPPEAARNRPRWPVYVAVVVAVPIFALLVERNTIAGRVLTLFGGAAIVWLIVEAVRSSRVDRDRLFVVLVLMFFSMLFWAFFEQAGSSMNNFADRNVDRVIEARNITQADVGATLELRVPLEASDPSLMALPALTQEQLGHDPGQGKPFNLTELSALREQAVAGASRDVQVLSWQVEPSSVGMGIGGAEIPASLFQATNGIFILLLGLVFTALWSFLGARGVEPSTPVKFGLGLFQLGLGFVALWYAAEKTADARGMVGAPWLILAYLLHTMGELCLSPVGLSMVTKLSPRQIVSTVMGAWFLAMAFSNFLGGLIAQLTGVSGEGSEAPVIPPPNATLHVYGEVFGQIGVIALGSAVICWALSPLLKRWMHTDIIEPAPVTADIAGADTVAP
jgi:proton-dependent oligopeptide transporter, POT family